MAILGVFIILSVMGRRREIDQKILFIYRYQQGGFDGSQYKNKGYFIDGKGNQVEYDYTKSLGSHEDGPNNCELLEMLEGMEFEKGEVIFSEREVEKLYDWLYKIDVGCEIERKYVAQVNGSCQLLGIRYKEDETAEIIQIFEAGSYKIENRDPYALKIRKVLLEKNPIAYWLEIIINGEMVSLYLQERLFM